MQKSFQRETIAEDYLFINFLSQKWFFWFTVAVKNDLRKGQVLQFLTYGQVNTPKIAQRVLT